MAVDVAGPQTAARRASAAARAIARLRKNRLVRIGGVVVAVLVVAAVAAPWIAPYDPLATSIRERFQPPGAGHLMGTDNFGRDMLSRVLYGARVSLFFGAAVAVATIIAGSFLGAVAGFVRSVDNLIMRAMDALMAFPAILLAIGIAAALGSSSINGIIALSVVYTPPTARLLRASVLVARELDYVEAARAFGARESRVLFRHILPNCVAPLIVQVTFVFAYAVIAEAILGFLGLGPQPPTPTWGNLIAEGREYLIEAPWICLFPGLALGATVLGLNLLGDGLRDALDPRLGSSKPL